MGEQKGSEISRKQKDRYLINGRTKRKKEKKGVVDKR
jgi:hypothetical protein